MRGFCTNCKKEGDYLVIKNLSQKIVKGYEIEYEKKEAICSECQQLVLVEEIHEENVEAAKKAYQDRVSNEAIELIQTIMSKYNVGKRPLSLLLDWGELTITRYLKGMIPKKEYLNFLKEICDDVHKFEEMLQRNQSKITKTAYQKCLSRVESLLLEENSIVIPIKNSDSNHRIDGEALKVDLERDDEVNQSVLLEDEDPSISTVSDFVSQEKIFKVVDYILCLSDDITPLALQKILYYAQAFFKVFYGYHLFENDCEAWDQGPVYPEIYFKFQDYQYILPKTEECLLDEEEQFFIELIMRYLGCYSGKALERMTHCEKPWRETRKGVDSTQRNKIIAKELIESYFYDVYKKYNMLSITDIVDYSTALFSRVL